VIALLLALQLGAPPTVPDPPILACPSGTTLRGAGPPDGVEAWCEGPNEWGRPRRHGPTRTWYDDGGSWLDEAYADGLRDGPFLERHRNGKPARQGTWARGERTGRWTVWYESGQLEEEATWVHDALHGPFTTWYRNGKKKTEGRWCLGIQCGRWMSWDEEGRELGRAEFIEPRGAP